ncbi:MAG: hypothetical protein ACPGUD_09565 [Parashewanella sp.]
MSGIKKHLKKLCKKQAKKAVRKMNKKESIKTSKKADQRQKKMLAKAAYKRLTSQLVIPTKNKIKQQVKLTIAQLTNAKHAKNDAQFQTKNSPNTIIKTSKAVPNVAIKTRFIDDSVNARQPLKSKPCNGCPALKKGLCKCALKMQRMQKVS